MGDNYHSQKEWDAQLNFIAELHLDNGLSHAQIAERLGEEKEFETSSASIKKRLRAWRIPKTCTPAEELVLLARSFLQHQRLGQHVTFHRCGKEYPSQKILDYIESNPTLAPSPMELPAHLKIVFPLQQPHESMDVSTQSAGPQTAPERPVAVASNIGKRQRSSEEHEARPKKTQNVTRRSAPMPAHEASTPTSQFEHEVDTNKDSADKETQNKKNAQMSMDQKKSTMKKLLADIEAFSEQFDRRDEARLRAIQQLKQTFGAVIEDEENVPRRPDETDLGPLHLAVSKNDRLTLRRLLDKGANVNAKGSHGRTPLNIAATLGHVEILNMLLGHSNIEINAIDNDGDTALICAASRPSLGCAIILVEAGADVDVIGLNNKIALHHACAANGLSKLVGAIVKKTKMINHQDINGLTPLHTALNARFEDYARTLIDAQADLDAQDVSGRTPLHVASFQASSDFLLYALEKPADLSMKGAAHETMLHILCQRELPEVVGVALTKPRVDVNAKAHRNWTPLMLAAGEGNFRTVDCLVENGADVTLVDDELDTALTRAIRKGCSKTIEILIDHDSPLDPQGKSLKRWKAKCDYEWTEEEVLSAIPASKSSAKRSVAQRTTPATESHPIQSSMMGMQTSDLQHLMGQINHLSRKVDQLSQPNHYGDSIMPSGPMNQISAPVHGLDNNQPLNFNWTIDTFANSYPLPLFSNQTWS